MISNNFHSLSMWQHFRKLMRSSWVVRKAKQLFLVCLPWKCNFLLTLHNFFCVLHITVFRFSHAVSCFSIYFLLIYEIFLCSCKFFPFSFFVVCKKIPLYPYVIILVFLYALLMNLWCFVALFKAFSNQFYLCYSMTCLSSAVLLKKLWKGIGSSSCSIVVAFIVA